MPSSSNWDILRGLGIHRVIEPARSLPQAAWKLDNTPYECWLACAGERSFSQVCTGKPNRTSLSHRFLVNGVAFVFSQLLRRHETGGKNSSCKLIDSWSSYAAPIRLAINSSSIRNITSVTQFPSSMLRPTLKL